MPKKPKSKKPHHRKHTRPADLPEPKAGHGHLHVEYDLESNPGIEALAGGQATIYDGVSFLKTADIGTIFRVPAGSYNVHFSPPDASYKAPDDYQGVDIPAGKMRVMIVTFGAMKSKHHK